MPGSTRNSSSPMGGLTAAAVAILLIVVSYGILQPTGSNEVAGGEGGGGGGGGGGDGGAYDLDMTIRDAVVGVDPGPPTAALVLATSHTFPSDTNIHLKHVCRLLSSLASLDRGTTSIRLGVPARELELSWPMLPHEVLGLQLESPGFVLSSSPSQSPSLSLSLSSPAFRRQRALVRDAWYRRAAFLSRSEAELEGYQHQLPYDGTTDGGPDSLLSLTTWSASVLMQPEVWEVYRDIVVTGLRRPSSLHSSLWGSSAEKGRLVEGEEARREKLRALCRGFP